MQVFIYITDIDEAVRPTAGSERMYLPLALHQLVMTFIYTLRMLHPFRIFQLISVIFHKISIFRTSKQLNVPMNSVIIPQSTSTSSQKLIANFEVQCPYCSINPLKLKLV